MKKEKKADSIKFPRWFHPLEEPVLCPTIKAAIEKHRAQYEKLKAEFEGV